MFKATIFSLTFLLIRSLQRRLWGGHIIESGREELTVLIKAKRMFLATQISFLSDCLNGIEK